MFQVNITNNDTLLKRLWGSIMLAECSQRKWEYSFEGDFSFSENVCVKHR